VGFELVIVGYGAQGYCGMCPGQLQNASWVAWFKSNVDFARSLGVGVSAYTLMQHNGWGESVPSAEQVSVLRSNPPLLHSRYSGASCSLYRTAPVNVNTQTVYTRIHAHTHMRAHTNILFCRP
jgi:hypothetical protein